MVKLVLAAGTTQPCRIRSAHRPSSCRKTCWYTALHFWATLIVLGVGWNFAFVGASALVLETHRPQERNKVQAFNDFLVFGMMAVGSFSSGQLLANYGWSAVNMVVFPPVVLGLMVLAVASLAKRRVALQQVPEFPDPGI